MQADLPLTVAEWPRNSRETIRVRLDRYNGQVVVDCRSWWRDTDRRTAARQRRPDALGKTPADAR